MIETCPYPAPTEKNITSMPALLYFIWEREAIRLGRENEDYTGELTQDPILISGEKMIASVSGLLRMLSVKDTVRIYGSYFCYVA